MKYQYAILGGGFDRLHRGHKAFISAAENSSENITIGLVSDAFLGERIHKDLIEPYVLRKQNLEYYLNENKWLTKTEIIPLNDIYGNALTKQKIDAIFAIDESLENAKLINKKRYNKGWPELRIEIVPMQIASDGGFISSKRIRNGEIDRDGNSYLKLFEHDLTLPDSLRGSLKKPFGEIIKNDSEFALLKDKPTVITVGDIATYKLIKAGRIPDIAIYDGKTNRKELANVEILSSLPKPTCEFANKPGTISNEIVAAINIALRAKKQATIQVEGEEDLLTIPSVLLAPLSTIVVYGIKGIGGIAIEVNEIKKEEFVQIAKKFKISS